MKASLGTLSNSLLEKVCHFVRKMCVQECRPMFFSDDGSVSVSGNGVMAIPRPASSSRGSFNSRDQAQSLNGGHLTPSHFARSSSLGGHTRAATSSSSNGHPTSGSLGQESGFQSCTSLVSLNQSQQQAKHSLFRGSPLAQRLQSDVESSLSGSMASLASGVIVPSLVNGNLRFLAKLLKTLYPLHFLMEILLLLQV